MYVPGAGRLVRACAFAILLLLASCATVAPRDPNCCMIEWGWGTPRLQQMPDYIDAAQALPFDGVVLDVESPLDGRGLSWTLFGDQSLDETEIQQLAAQYGDLEWGRLSHNFLRLNLYPANVGWFEDWQAINHNAEVWARLAHDLGFAGILFDVEQYGDIRLFEYAAQPGDRDFDAYRDQARQRGRDYMNALETGFPGLTVMLTFGLTIDEPDSDWIRHRYGLLPPFIEGMQAAANRNTTLVDGYEGSYIYQDEAQFNAADQWIEATGLETGFGLWIDPVCGDGGLPPEGCGFSPEGFEYSLRQALTYSDQYVWIYSQKINWYTGEGIPPVWQETLSTFR